MRRWDQLVQEHGPAVFATVWHVLGDADETEAVVQEVFGKASAARLGREGWETLLRRLAVSLALERLRQIRLAPEIDTEPADLLRAALQRLPHVEAAAFALCYFEDLSDSEIAEVLQLGRSAVGVALSRGRARLAALLREPTSETPHSLTQAS